MITKDTNFYIKLIFVLSIVLISKYGVNSQVSSAQPLEKILRADGTIMNTELNGKFDPSGWIMKTNQDGTPYFVRAEETKKASSVNKSSSPDDIYWDNIFGLNGINGFDVKAVVANGEDLYVGGEFQAVGNLNAGGIFKYNPNSGCDTLNKLGNHYIKAIAFQGEKMYVAGMLYEPGINEIACWDGNKWSSLGEGISGSIEVIAVNENDVYIGGYISTAGGIDVKNIARWDGNSWSALGDGINGVVSTIAIKENDVYVGGMFSTAGGINANNIARWDGNSWSAIESGTNAWVKALLFDGDNLYVGGFFTEAGGMEALAIAKWDGNSWSSLERGLLNPGNTGGIVTCLTIHQNDLYVGGTFVLAGNEVVANIAKWDGNSWSTLGGGINGTVYSIDIIDNDLYVGGMFLTAGGINAKNIAKWDGNNWSSLNFGGYGTDFYVNAMAKSESAIYVGGSFNLAGDKRVNKIAKWDGYSWSSLGGGIDGDVYAIAVNNNDVYVGGWFDKAGNTDANNIAKWDGNNWSALGNGINNYVSVIEIKGDDIYVGGAFNWAGGLNVANIAKWDGNNWHTLGSGISDEENSGVVNDIAIDGEEIYIAGRLNMTDSDTIEYLAKWKENYWSSIPVDLEAMYSPTGASINSIEIHNDNIYIGGTFNVINGDTIYSGVAKWDGINWSTLGTENNKFIAKGPIVNSVRFYDENLYAAGFVHIDDGSQYGSRGIIKWDGTKWSGLGSGISGGTYPPAIGTMEIFNNSIYIGGNFTFAGGKPSSYFGRWFTTLTNVNNNLEDKQKGFTLGQNYPNPTNTSTTIEFTINETELVNLTVYNILGMEVLTLVNKKMPKGTYEVTFDVSNLNENIYLYSLTVGDSRITKRMMVWK